MQHCWLIQENLFLWKTPATPAQNTSENKNNLENLVAYHVWLFILRNVGKHKVCVFQGKQYILDFWNESGSKHLMEAFLN